MSAKANRPDRPSLIFFHSPRSGRSRRAEGYLSQVLQRRGNHETFQIYRVDASEQPELAQRFEIEDVPTIVVVENKSVRGRVSPGGCTEIERLLRPWLR